MKKQNLLLREIRACIALRGVCKLSDKCFADVLGISERSVRRYLESLKNKNIITCSTKTMPFSGRRERTIRIVKTATEQADCSF